MSQLTTEQQYERAMQIGRVDEVRADLSRNYDTYAHATERAESRLKPMAGSSDPEVRKAVTGLASEYDLDVSRAGMKQPPTPKKHSPFAD